MSTPTLVFTTDAEESGMLLPDAEKGHHPADGSEAHTPHSAHPTLGHGFSSGSILRSRSVRYVAARYQQGTDRARQFWGRLTGKGRRRIGWAESFRNIALSSWLNVLFIMIPFAWASYWAKWGETVTFVLCLIAIIPLEGMFDWGGEQMLLYLGRDLGDLLVVTLNNAVEAVLAIVLLRKCDLRLLQSTLVGVIVLHLLLIPGTAFLVGGSEIRHQTLHPHHANLNHSLLLIGVLATLLPTALFSALDEGANAAESAAAASEIVKDATIGILHISRGIAVILLVIYVASRFYLHDPPPANNALLTPVDPHPAIKHEETRLLVEEPKTNAWACMLVLTVTVAMMAVTADFLVESIEYVREERGISEEWFGLILLPFVSFSADGVIAILFFMESTYDHITGKRTQTPSMLARGRGIDLSIQFTLWWMPFLVILGWLLAKPMHLLFDSFEVGLLLGSCLLVNYVTADAQTNWVEGLIMISFYMMIAVTAWFYPGHPEEHYNLTLQCAGSAAHGEEAVAELVHRAMHALR
ncbi:hypothetical protein L226DRAFT_615691 [Lentinus tigrinus ALCF2SS1-7]|uniref:Sodium/calcium exchanger membrane region domain-containing protein n=1 Tax=Lentinus tigrinus ALCF2SS1-6 TaxID=1328759 RepID=A0A5C2S0K9_9APHY|nr:hypothetical protein L227DRAFT_578494 [Lentinus tigrinus ALCF2SS1-6]RPD71172.1 hypothetical protein L226DRAFT_615691 [Lentinus tigrinus ALCF2SS1-7]